MRAIRPFDWKQRSILICNIRICPANKGVYFTNTKLSKYFLSPNDITCASASGGRDFVPPDLLLRLCPWTPRGDFRPPNPLTFRTPLVNFPNSPLCNDAFDGIIASLQTVCSSFSRLKLFVLLSFGRSSSSGQSPSGQDLHIN